MPKRPRQPGEFCWFNLVTPDASGTREFFARVFGWTYGDIPNVGHTIHVDGSVIGGVFDIATPGTPPGAVPVLAPMVRVVSADAAAERSVLLGGGGQPAFDVMENGRMSELADPDGAKLDVWQPKRQIGTDADPAAHGAPSWFELVTRDVVVAQEYYAQLFSWSVRTMPMPGGEYTVFQLGETAVAGATQVPASARATPPAWHVYFTSHDVDATHRDALALGASSLSPVTPVPGVGRMCGLATPQGVPFHVMQYER